MEKWLFAVVAGAATFAILGIGVNIWIMAWKEWKDRK